MTGISLLYRMLADSSDDGLGDLSELPADEAEEVKATRTAAYGKCRLWVL